MSGLKIEWIVEVRNPLGSCQTRGSPRRGGPPGGRSDWRSGLSSERGLTESDKVEGERPWEFRFSYRLLHRLLSRLIDYKSLLSAQ